MHIVQVIRRAWLLHMCDVAEGHYLPELCAHEVKVQWSNYSQEEP